ncbi:hypothetical protein PR202_ga20750 [Eleusine coracana subsp. coracana]|uniref:Pirin-like protein n=1 Tax=Eleusine coracana subsp. coracana TaxID=191504 RepID=A0AAV5CYL4_ELECO|nr:hypothetical protein QOZ80_8AG0627710 [Eleusine coracana subsp. coracana]GJN03320.1 hypothetical protein PR202_ga20750 [Eleusine coracana subsp. coracana]
MAPPSLSSSASSHHHRSSADELAAELTKAANEAIAVQTERHHDDVMSKPREVVRTLKCQRKQVGEGLAVWRSIGRAELPDLDPFLSFDEIEISPPAGFLDHPHRGFETVTYMLEGGVSYHDFSGHKGTVSTGDIQWMTAGRGVVHAEMPGGEGVQRGISIWINLASKDKMVEPRYQETASADIPVADKDGVSVKILAGDCLGTRSALRPRTPAMCLDVTLQPGARLRQPVPRGWSACAYVIAGEAVFDDLEGGAAQTATGSRTLAVFGGDGDCVDVRAEEGGPGARVLVVAARPHGEAVVRDGPFVMNTKEEVEQAREDYRLRRNGFEMADGWASDHANTAADAAH